MKLKYPAEAFAFGIVLFSAGMKEAFAAGILVILATVFAEALRNLLKDWVPEWSLYLCVCIGTVAVCASVFLLGFTALGIPVDNTGMWIMTCILGLFIVKHVLTGAIDGEYGELFWETAIAWGFWILLAVAREFFGAGTIFETAFVRQNFSLRFFRILCLASLLQV